MATGAPDWNYRANIDIVTQTLASLAVDIIAQSVGDLAVDIAAQAIGNLAVDIAAQTVGDLDVNINAQANDVDVNLAAQDSPIDIDIVAQNVGNLDVNLAAQDADIDVNLAAQDSDIDVNLNAQAADIDVNLAAQDANIDIDLVAQSIGNIDIDVAAQALSEVINRPTYGGAQSGTYSGTPASGTTTLLTVNGTGMIYGGYLYVTDTSTHVNDYPYVEIDGQAMATLTFSAYMQYAPLKPHMAPIFIIKYDNVNFRYAIGFSYGLTFESSFVVKYFNAYADATNVVLALHYATI